MHHGQAAASELAHGYHRQRPAAWCSRRVVHDDCWELFVDIMIQIHTVAIADVYLALAGRAIKVVQYVVDAVERLKTGVREPVRSRQQ